MPANPVFQHVCVQVLASSAGKRVFFFSTFFLVAHGLSRFWLLLAVFL